MTSHTVAVRVDDRYKTRVEPGALREAAEATLGHKRVEEAYDLTVVVTGDQVLRELNRRHRGLDRSTDVLAFPNETRGPFVDVPALLRYLGDVIISFPQAETQALEAGNDLSAELQLLVVHGVLHLLGYDDQTQPERTRMWQAQQTVLDELGVEVNLAD
jgi:probable rRNA maturation factor